MNINDTLKKTHKASTAIQRASDEQIKNILFNLADELIADRALLLEANFSWSAMLLQRPYPRE